MDLRHRFGVKKLDRAAPLAAALGAAAASSLPGSGRGAVTGAAEHGGQAGHQHLGAAEPMDLKHVGPSQQVASIQCVDQHYCVTTVSGATVTFPEFNMRFKTDSGANGPVKGAPVLIAAGTQGDRAYLVFADAREISALISTR
jgi:cytochrome c